MVPGGSPLWYGVGSGAKPLRWNVWIFTVKIVFSDILYQKQPKNLHKQETIIHNIMIKVYLQWPNVKLAMKTTVLYWSKLIFTMTMQWQAQVIKFVALKFKNRDHVCNFIDLFQREWITLRHHCQCHTSLDLRHHCQCLTSLDLRHHCQCLTSLDLLHHCQCLTSLDLILGR